MKEAVLQNGLKVSFFYKKDYELAKEHSFDVDFCFEFFKEYTCPECLKTYLILKSSKRHDKCDFCKISKEKREKQGEKISERYKNYTPERLAEINEKTKHLGNKNGMYGRSVYSVWLEKYGKEEADRRLKEYKENQRHQYKNYTPEQLAEINEKTKHFGNKNGMYGRSVYSVWLEKYGKEEADRRNEEMNRKRKGKNTGKNNHQYGKPAAKNSGCGISGWYKDWYFRSLGELTYVLKILEVNNVVWKSIDSLSEFQIEYLDLNGNKRNYFPDFLINNKTIIEIKPVRLQKTKINQLKFKAAEEWCKSKGFEFNVVSVKNIDRKELDELVKNGTIKLIDRWKNRLYGNAT